MLVFLGKKVEGDILDLISLIKMKIGNVIQDKVKVKIFIKDLSKIIGSSFKINFFSAIIFSFIVVISKEYISDFLKINFDQNFYFLVLEPIHPTGYTILAGVPNPHPPFFVFQFRF